VILRELETVARCHAWRHHPVEASVFCLGTMSAVTFSVCIPLHLGVLALVAGLVAATRIPVVPFLKAMFVPMSFLLAGVAGIVVGIRLAPLCVFWEPGSAGIAAMVASRSVAALSCGLLWAFSVPFDRMLMAARWCRTPEVVLELSVLVRRSILLLEEALGSILQAQVARNGYGDLRSSRRSVGLAVANLFARTIQSARRQEEAMASRNGVSVPVSLGEVEVDVPWIFLAIALPSCLVVLEVALGRS